MATGSARVSDQGTRWTVDDPTRLAMRQVARAIRAPALGAAGCSNRLRRIGLRDTFAEVASAQEGEYSPV